MRRRLACWGVVALLGCSSARPPVAGESAVDQRLRALAPAAARDEVHGLERSRAAAAALVPFLRHADAEVRARAALALARVADPAAADALIHALADPAPAVRAQAAFALGNLDGELPLLADQLAAGHKGSEAWVREAATVRASAERALDARLHVEQNPLVRHAVYAALGQLAIGPGLHHIYAGLQGDADDAAHAALAYGVHAWRRGAQAHKDPALFARLIELGSADNSDVRFGAVYALARHEACAAAPLFADRIAKDADAGVRSWAARGLGACPGQAKALLSALVDTDWRVRVESLRALARLARGGEPIDSVAVASAIEATAASLVAPDVPPNLALAHVVSTGLPLMTDEAALRRLLDRVRLAPAQRDLTALRCEIEVAITARTLDLAPLAQCGRSGEPVWQVRLREIRALDQAAQVKPPLRIRLHGFITDPEPRVRAAAVSALAAADDAATRALLVARLAADSDPATIEALADAVGAWPADGSLAAALQIALTRTDGARDAAVLSARVALARALAVHGKQTVAELLARLAEGDALAVRNAVRRALGLRPVYGLAPTFGPAPTFDATGLAARIVTARGTIELRLDAAAAPETAANFVRLARAGLFDGLTFHRVVPDFVVQGGDPRGDGYGGPGYVIPCELTPRPFTPGVVGMALAGKDTGGSQFFITQSRQPHLDGHYTVFAEVSGGLEVVESLQADDVIRSVEIVTAPKPEPLTPR